MNATPSASTDDIVALLRGEFLSDARDWLEIIQHHLDVMHGAETIDGECFLEIRREVHNLNGMGATFGFPAISLIAHRLEDFLASIETPDHRQIADIQVFQDHLLDIVSLGEDPGDEASGDIIRRLPVHSAADTPGVVPRDVEVLLVTPTRTIAGMLSRMLVARGYRVTVARSPWQAFELAALTRPDLIITSAVLDRLSGIDLARAFSAMTITAHVPLAVLTSFARNHREVQNLPPDTAIIRLNDHLNDDLAGVVARFEGDTADHPAEPTSAATPGF